MDRPPNEGFDWFGERPYFFDWQDDHNFVIEVTWNEVEGKFAITCLDLSEQEGGNGSGEDASFAFPVSVVQAAEAVAGAVAGTIVGVITAINIRNSQNGQGDSAVPLPVAPFSAPAHSTQPQGASASRNLSTRAEETMMWYQAVPASKIAEVSYGFDAAAAAAYAAAAATPSQLQGNADREANESPNQNEEASTSLLFELSGAGEEEACLEYGQHDLDLDLEIQIDNDAQAPEAVSRPTGLVRLPETTEAAAKAQRGRSWTGLFSFQDLQVIHQQLSALCPELESCLPVFPDDMCEATFTANPGRLPSDLENLCIQLQVYLDFALAMCGQEILCQVLFREEAESPSPEMSPQPSQSLLHLPLGNAEEQDPAISCLLRPYPGSGCDFDQNSKKDPDCGGSAGGPGPGGPSGGCGGASF